MYRPMILYNTNETFLIFLPYIQSFTKKKKKTPTTFSCYYNKASMHISDHILQLNIRHKDRQDI